MASAEDGEFSIRVTKTARKWLEKNGSGEIIDLLQAAQIRQDGAAPLFLNKRQLRELWHLMDEMLDEMQEARYTPGVNSATGMQRKAERFMPGLPW